MFSKLIALSSGFGFRAFALTAALVATSAVVAGEPHDAPHGTTPIRLGESVAGWLGWPDGLLDTGEFYEAWAFELSESRMVKITMASGSVDAYVMLTASQQRLEAIAADDDSGGGTDAQMYVTLSPGAYTILATSFAPFDAGGYRLRLEDVSECHVTGPVAPEV